MKKRLFLAIAAFLMFLLAACATAAEEEEATDQLIFNTPEPTSEMQISPVFYVEFSHPLTDEELRAVFPYLDLPLAATAHYKGDGTLVEFDARIPWEGVDGVPQGLQIRFWMEGFSYDFHRYEFARDFTPRSSNIYGIPVTAYIIQGWDDVMSFRAEFMLDNFVYRVLFRDYAESGQAWMTEIVSGIIRSGTEGLAVLADPVIPELRSEQMTLAEARLDPDFGAFVPSDIPDELIFEFAHRSLTQHDDILWIEWQVPQDYDDLYDRYTQWIAARSPDAPVDPFEEIFWGGTSLRWRVSTVREFELERIVSVNAPEQYDWSLYPLVARPGDLRKFHEIPDAYWFVFHEPVFLAEEFTLDVVQAREMMRVWIIQAIDGSYSDDMREIFIPVERYELEFGVLFGDTLVHVSSVGVSVEEVWAMLAPLF